jgi:hypothetical protein
MTDDASPPNIRPGPYQFMPDLAPEIFAALKADVAKRGVLTPIDVDENGYILDGHNRWRAHQESGRNEAPPVIVRSGLSEAEKMSFARRQNILRRHLSREEMRAVIAGQLRDTPERSNRSIAADLGVDHKTVGAVRKGAGGEIPQVGERVGRDGKKYRSATKREGERIARMFGTTYEENAKRIAAMPDDWKATMFSAGIPIDRITIVDAPPPRVQTLKPDEIAAWDAWGYPEFGPNEVAAWNAFAEYLGKDAEFVDWLLRHGYRTPDEWLGEQGQKYRATLRARGFSSIKEPSAEFVEGWRQRSKPE